MNRDRRAEARAGLWNTLRTIHRPPSVRREVVPLSTGPLPFCRKALFISGEHGWTLHRGTLKNYIVQMLLFAIRAHVIRMTPVHYLKNGMATQWSHQPLRPFLHQSPGKGLFIRIWENRKKLKMMKGYRGKYCLCPWGGKYETIWVSQDDSLFTRLGYSDSWQATLSVVPPILKAISVNTLIITFS